MLMAGSAVANANNVENKDMPVTKAYQSQAVQDVLLLAVRLLK